LDKTTFPQVVKQLPVDGTERNNTKKVAYRGNYIKRSRLPNTRHIYIPLSNYILITIIY